MTWPKGQLQLPKDDLYTYVNLLNGQPFNSTIASPADIGKSVSDLTAQTVKGTYLLRIRWVEPERPRRARQKVFSYDVR